MSRGERISLKSPPIMHAELMCFIVCCIVCVWWFLRLGVFARCVPTMDMCVFLCVSAIPRAKSVFISVSVIEKASGTANVSECIVFDVSVCVLESVRIVDCVMRDSERKIIELLSVGKCL